MAIKENHWQFFRAAIGLELVALVLFKLFPNTPTWFVWIIFGLGIVLIFIDITRFLIRFHFRCFIFSWLASFKGVKVDFCQRWLNLSSRSEMVGSRGDLGIWTKPDWRVTGVDFFAKNKLKRRLLNINGFIKSKETGMEIPLLIDGATLDAIESIPSNAPFRISARFPRSTQNQEGWTLDDFWNNFGEFNLSFKFNEKKISKFFSQNEIEEKIKELMKEAEPPPITGPRVQRSS